MNFRITVRKRIGILLLCFTSVIGSAQEQIAVIQEPFVVLLNPADGSIEDPSFIDLTALSPGTPKGLLQVDDEIWVTDQIEDRIDRFDLNGTHLSAVNTGLDNVKGLAVVNDEVWVTNAGSNNDAPGEAIVRLDFDGNNLGFYETTGSAFDIIDVGGEVYVSFIGATSRIERWDYDGNILGNIVEEGVVSFIQQIEQNTDNSSILAAVFSSNGSNGSGLYEFAEADGSILNYYDVGGLRGISMVDDGNILFTSGNTLNILDPSTETATELSTGGPSHYFARVNLNPLGIDDLNNTSVSLFPNPARNIITIEYGNRINGIEITNSLGQIVLAKQGNSSTVNMDVSSLASGTYIVKVLADNRETMTKLIIN